MGCSVGYGAENKLPGFDNDLLRFTEDRVGFCRVGGFDSDLLVFFIVYGYIGDCRLGLVGLVFGI